MSNTDSRLLLGQDREDQQAIDLDPGILLRHMLALGSSGSGKTVLSKAVVEEMIRKGIPAICVDPQGDLCSLGIDGKPDDLQKHNVDTSLAADYADRADVVVFTPAGEQGVPLIADPLQMELTHANSRERTQAITAMATQLVALLGYDLDSDDGEGLVAVFDRALTLLWERQAWPESVAAFSSWFACLQEDELNVLERYLDRRRIEKAGQKLARLDVGARRHLFHDGLPLDIDTLLGRNDRLPVPEGKTRLAVIYLNTLHSQEDKAFLIAALAERLYSWMLQQPSHDPQLLFYIDEIAPFIPPVRKPASKPALSLIFKQARKYGVCCLMATQNPGDLDYKALAQFGTWALGRMTVRQDIRKVASSVRGLDPDGADEILESLPGQTAGQFMLISPDAFERTRPLACRWLYSRHRTLDEDAIAELARHHGWHKRYSLTTRPVRDSATPPAPNNKGKPGAPHQAEAADNSKTRATTRPTTESATNRASTKPRQASGENPGHADFLDVLATRPSMSAADFSHAAQISESSARRVLKAMVASGGAGQFKQGRSNHYWAKHSGFRPDLGLTELLPTFEPLIDQERARKLAVEEYLEGSWMGMFGFDEHLEDMQLVHRPLLRLRFREKVRRSILKRLFGPSHDEFHDSLYLHPGDLRYVLFSRERGVRLEEQLDHELASSVEDFDGISKLVAQPPGKLSFDVEQWQKRCTEEEAIQQFRQHFAAEPENVETVFLPVWEFRYSAKDRGKLRLVTVDALAGRPVDW